MLLFLVVDRYRVPVNPPSRERYMTEEEFRNGPKPEPQRPFDPHSLAGRVLLWLVTDNVGASSTALAFEALGLTHETMPWPPSDAGDLFRCLYLIERVPEARAAVDSLGQRFKPWARAAAVWDQITAQLREEMGLRDSERLPDKLPYRGVQGHEKTFSLMKKAGL